MPAAPADVQAPPADAITTPTGLASKVIEPGSGTEKPGPADTVTVHYTGWTTDVDKRLDQHNKGKGAKYTRGRLPVKLRGFWRFQNRSEAMRFEHWLKQLPRTAKETFLKEKPCPSSA